MSTSLDGGTLVLYAVAAAVIGGTSLFGGRGKAIHAVLGGLVIAAIDNGMGLQGYSASAKYVVTALVLLAAVTIDAVARRSASRPLIPVATRCSPAVRPAACWTRTPWMGAPDVPSTTMTVDHGREVVLEVRGLSKQFGRLRVLDRVDLDVRGGEILALVGENGAGKSTAVGCIARTIAPDAGTFVLDGEPLATDPIGARDQGIAVVWQDLALCDNLSVVANLFLGSERTDRGVLDDRTMADEARRLFGRLHLPTDDLFRPVGQLSGGQRQLVAIARAVRRHPSVLILDEPTAALGVAETVLVERLLADLRGNRGRRHPLFLVSHRLDQVFALADRIAVLRQSRLVAAVSTLEVHPDDVAAMMSGIETDSSARRQLRRLSSLVEELADVDPAAGLSLILSAMVESLGVDRLCVHLFDDEGVLRRMAAVGLGPGELTIAGPQDAARRGGGHRRRRGRRRHGASARQRVVGAHRGGRRHPRRHLRLR